MQRCKNFKELSQLLLAQSESMAQSDPVLFFAQKRLQEHWPDLQSASRLQYLPSGTLFAGAHTRKGPQ